MRPRGEIRQALAHAAEALFEQRQTGVTWRELGAAAQVGFRAAQQCAKDMARAGELQVVGTTRVPGVCRPMRLYAPAKRRGWVTQGAALGDVLSAWAKG